jgi:hypothetical protein
MASFKVSQFTGVTDTTDDSLLMLSYTSDAGASFSTRKIRVADLLNDIAQDSDVSALVTLSGVPAGSTDLGAFTGDTIADSSTIKGALQQLETALELKQGALTAGNGISIDEFNEINVIIAADSYLQFNDSAELGVKVLDEDDLSGNSDQHLPTQQSVKAYVDSSISGLGAIADGKFIHKDGSVAFTGDQSMGGFKLTNLGTPTQDTDAATKLYVDMAVQGLDAKASCLAASTANLTLSGTQTIDGVSVSSGDRVLVKDQTAGEDNGIYVAAAGAWARANDADGVTRVTNNGEITSGLFTFIEQGTTNGSKGFVLITPDPIDVGVTELVFTQFSEAGSATAGEGIVINGNEISVDPAVLQDIADLATLSGVTANSTDLGLFTGSTIADNSTIKAALQSLEVKAEQNASANGNNSTVLADHETRISQNETDINALQNSASGSASDIADILTTIGTADGDTNIGTFTGGTITDNVSVKTALQELETALEAVAADSGSGSAVSANAAEIAALRQAQGTANGDVNLGTFAGSTISDNVSVKTALGELEAAVDSLGTDISNGNFVSEGDNVNELVGSTVAEAEPANYLFMVVDQSNGAIKVLSKTFIETEESD